MPTYKEAGVDLDKADRLVSRLAAHQQRSEKETSKSLFQGFGDFAAGYDLSDYENPVILSTCDGVGTKFLLQKKHDALESAGIDLVAMNVNDLLTTGADPLLFLDYVAMSPLDEETVDALVRGMTRACTETDCLLAGGETAELPGMLEEGDVELAGFCVGAAEKKRIADSPAVEPGQAIVGVPSDGIHANGFSLVRAVLDEYPDQFTDDEEESLLTPTRLYFQEVQALHELPLEPSGMVHVTGGGLRGNLSRVLPDGIGATLELPEWDRPVISKILEQVSVEEAFKTFNMGFGWLILADDEQVDELMSAVTDSVRLGTVTDTGSIDMRYAGEPV
jgi:phosphoribosylformylglycinamidine cyclo-ligase